MSNKKIISLILIITGIGMTVYGFYLNKNKSINDNPINKEESVLKYEYFDNYIPGETYTIELNKETKELKGEFYHACSAVDCDGDRYNYTVTLTDEELTKILKLWNYKDELSPILECICENNMIMYNSFEESFEESIEEYNAMDINSDGKISSREFGNRWLDYAIEEVLK